MQTRLPPRLIKIEHMAEMILGTCPTVLITPSMAFLTDYDVVEYNHDVV